MSLPKFHASELLRYSTKDLWDILTGEFILIFPDGELHTNYRETLFSSELWDVLRKFPESPLLMRYHLTHLMQTQRAGKESHCELMGKIVWGTYDVYKKSALDRKALLEVLMEMNFELSNNLYNTLIYKLEPWVGGLDLMDFIEVSEHPVVAKANKNVEPTAASITTARDTVFSAIMKPDAQMEKSRISLLSRSGIVNIGQALKCLAPIGFITDNDSHHFRRAILTYYLDGLVLLHDMVIESRTASKSLIFSKDALEKAEYLSRRQQLLSEILFTVHDGDCGSTDTVTWRLRDREVVNGIETRPSDLKLFRGKYHYLEDGSLVELMGDETHLVGKYIKFRSILDCAHVDSNGVCETCMGAMAEIIPRRTNVGQLCATDIFAKIAQGILSLKHDTGVSSGTKIKLDQDEKQFVDVTEDGVGYLINPHLKPSEVKLLIAPKDSTNLTDIINIRDITKIAITRITDLEGLTVSTTVESQGVTIKENKWISMGADRNNASLSYDMLVYLRTNSWETDKDGNTIIDLKDWDISKPIAIIPMKDFNMSDFSGEVKEQLESNAKDKVARDTTVNPETFLAETFDLMNSKLNINIAPIEVIVKSATVVSAQNHDYSLPKPWTQRGIGIMNQIMRFRSLAPMLAFQNQNLVFGSPKALLIENRPDHPLDYLVMPAEVTAHHISIGKLPKKQI